LNGLPLVLANPWGALALLGLPVVVVIHCLQQKSRRLPISTLFLLERLAPDSKEGRSLMRMRSSLPFWLQILSVLVLAWVLVEPRWLEANAVQRVVLVLDDSISMRAFSDDIVARTSPRLHSLTTLAPRTYWTVLETDPTRPTLYEGSDLPALEQKLRTWSPSLPANDPTHALGLARAIAPRDAVVIFVTDRPRDLPSGVDLLAIGEPIENCGLVGLRLLGTGGDLEWQVMAQNYGRKTAHRSWWLELAGKKTDSETIDLEPGHAQLLKGKFPPGIDRLEVCLQPDRFSVDDRMAIVRPAPKPLAVELHGDAATNDLFARLTQTLASLSVAQPGHPADIALDTLGPRTTFPGTDLSSIVLYDNPGAANEFKGGPFVVEDDPLNQDLNWQGLVMQPGPATPADADHQVLLWKDATPVIYLRPLGGDRRQLVFNFNFSTSNVARLPAFVLLIDRFVESIRLQKKEPETRNAELAENLTVAADIHGPSVVLQDSGGVESTVHPMALVSLRSPSLPGFFTITQGRATLLTGAAQFADARESDFSTAATLDSLGRRHTRLVEMHTRTDAIAPLWLVLIGVLLVLYWGATRPRIV
jgi:hypothetical protein